MSFSKCSNIEAENVIHFRLCHQEKTKLYGWIFLYLKIKTREKFKLKTKLNKTKFKNQFYTSYVDSFQLPNAVQSFKIHPMALEIYQLAHETFLSLKNSSVGGT